MKEENLLTNESQIELVVSLADKLCTAKEVQGEFYKKTGTMISESTIGKYLRKEWGKDFIAKRNNMKERRKIKKEALGLGEMSAWAAKYMLLQELICECKDMDELLFYIQLGFWNSHWNFKKSDNKLKFIDIKQLNQLYHLQNKIDITYYGDIKKYYGVSKDIFQVLYFMHNPNLWSIYAEHFLTENERKKLRKPRHYRQTIESKYEKCFEKITLDKSIFYIGLRDDFLYYNYCQPDFIWLEDLSNPVIIEVFATYHKIECQGYSSIEEYLNYRRKLFGLPVLGFDEWFFNDNSSKRIKSDSVRKSIINFLLDLHRNNNVMLNYDD